ncbi:MAG: glycosyltransferase family 2 protein [Pseudomonadota bacterium]
MPAPAHPRIATIIVNYRAGALITATLSALAAQQAPFGGPIIIVDNQSGNGDAEHLDTFVHETRLPVSVQVICHNQNAGWGGGNNVGLRTLIRDYPDTEYVLFLNPDARLEPGVLEALYAALAQDEKAGFAGCRIESGAGDHQSAAFRFYTALGEFESTVKTGPFTKILANRVVPYAPLRETTSVDWVSGAAFLARLDVVRACGLFDEGYFLYFDETDLMKTARSKGWHTLHVPAACAIHEEGFSTGTKGGVNAATALSPHYLRSRNFYLEKHRGPAKRTLHDFAWLLGTALYWVRLIVTGKNADGPRQHIRDFLAHWGKSERLL